jgi:hypothetical protein
MNVAPRFLTVEVLAVVAAGVSGFVDAHIWSPAYSYYSLLVLVVLDVVTNNLVEGKPLVPRNLVLRLLAYTVLLAFAHGFAEHEKGLFFLSQLAMAPFVIVHLRKLIISFSKLGLVDASVADLLQKRIGRASEVVADAAAEAAPVPEPPAPAPIPETALPVAP